jgi:VIT1/CCC1 family predicted Fe2+/Mn2+ transporter
MLIAPYLIFENHFVVLGATFANAVIIIATFNYYASVAKEFPFKKHFFEMVGLSFGVGYLMRSFFGVDV